MKTNKILTLAFSLVALLLINSCVEDDDFSLPELTIAPVNVAELGLLTSFSNIVARYDAAVLDGEQVGVFSVENEAPLYAVGYVVSDDGTGNFFEEISIQNSIDGSDPVGDVRRGLKVEINARDLGGFYNFGRKVFIKLNGLAIGLENGVYTLGKSNGNSLEQLEDATIGGFKEFIIRDPEVVTITPKVVAVEDLTDNDENTFIQLTNSQIVKAQKELTFAGEAADSFDGFRTITNCDTNASISLQTSTFADFKGAQLPQGRGAISGIYSRDFGDDFSVLTVNTVDDIDFSNADRCDPIVLECTDPVSTAVTVFNEDFQTITNESQLDALGWTNVNVSGGSERYEDNSFSGDTYMKISAFGTSESPLEAWLVTPAINLDGSTNEELTFEVSSNFETGKVLTALITENYTGDPLTTEWIELEANIPIGDGGFGDFVASNINISCLNGDVHVAFKYLGAAGGAETRYHIDDIKITGM
ncbi:DUF5689 domain-containing protein [Lacinutrix sp.]|uniref:DUF5689 domain-containing protein n=1 Tax=Lacinutrix sp. TaxID=1937692 RepID=UPI0025B9C95A|nr:DUF5689 domain-containing protein [Lacinutrix sp.]